MRACGWLFCEPRESDECQLAQEYIISRGNIYSCMAIEPACRLGLRRTPGRISRTSPEVGRFRSDGLRLEWSRRGASKRYSRRLSCLRELRQATRRFGSWMIPAAGSEPTSTDIRACESAAGRYGPIVDSSTHGSLARKRFCAKQPRSQTSCRDGRYSDSESVKPFLGVI
jgi:hypothetical protein